LGLLLTFRTNTAYDRWWEGRRLWGQLLNATRALAHHLDGLLAAHLAAGGAAEPGDDAPVSRRERYAALLGEFAAGLAAHVRRPRRAPGAAPGVAGPEGRAPNAVVRELARRVHADVAAGVLPREATLVLAPLLGTLDDVTGGCERIRNTPIPASYGAYLKFFVLLYTLALPVGLVRDFGYGAVPATMLVLFATAGVELLAEEIENPFGTDRHDLPIDELAARAAADARELLGSG
jgi:putative membrane protein